MKKVAAAQREGTSHLTTTRPDKWASRGSMAVGVVIITFVGDKEESGVGAAAVPAGVRLCSGQDMVRHEVPREGEGQSTEV